MPDKNLTDNEIVKALECCNEPVENNACQRCPLHHSEGRCSKNMLDLALDLINRLQGENERLLQKLQQAQEQKDKLMDAQMLLAKTSDEQQAEIEELKTENRILSQKRFNIFERIEFTDKLIKQAKSEARKEFAERLKATKHADSDVKYLFDLKIDNLLKEMESE